MTDVQRVVAELIETEENIFVILGLCSKHFKDAGQPLVARSLMEEVIEAHTYSKALDIIKRYMEIE